MAPTDRSPSRSRVRPSVDVEQEILVGCKRRCCLCFGLHGDLDVKEGQLAHIDRDSSNSSADNLAFLCGPHHNLYDTQYSQTKRYTAAEVRTYKEGLSRVLNTTLNWKFTIQGEFDEADRPFITSAVEELQGKVGDLKIIFERASSGSIVLEFKSSPAALLVLLRQHYGDDLSELLDRDVLGIEVTNGTDPQSLLTIGLEMFYAKDYVNSTSCLRLACKQAPNSPSLLLNLSSVLLQKFRATEDGADSKTLAEALDAISRANELSPNDPQILSNMGIIHSAIGNRAEARVSHDTAISLNPTDGHLWFNSSASHYEAEEYDEAIRALEKSASFGFPDALKALSHAKKREWKPWVNI